MNKERYRTDPEYRAAVIARVQRRHELNKVDQTYVRLVALRKQIWTCRDKIDNHLRLVERLEKKLIWLVEEKDKLSDSRTRR